MTARRPASPPTRNRVLAVLALVLVALMVWWLRGGTGTEEPSGPGTTPAATTSHPGATTPSPTAPTDRATPTTTQQAGPGADGIPACDPAQLPPELDGVVEDILAGGPYDYPRNDGVRFQNREGILPDEDPGYYREFTVTTPGVEHRGARRIVTGGEVEQDPDHWYFTADHYESFCAFTP